MLLAYEQIYFDAWEPEYNLSLIAGKVEITPEVRKKLSYGGKISTKDRIGPNHPNYGKPAWNRGKSPSDQTRKKMKESAKNKPVITDEHRKNLSIANVGNQNSKGRPAWNKGKALHYPVWNKGKKLGPTGKPGPNKNKPRSEETKAKHKATLAAKKQAKLAEQLMAAE